MRHIREFIKTNFWNSIGELPLVKGSSEQFLFLLWRIQNIWSQTNGRKYIFSERSNSVIKVVLGGGVKKFGRGGVQTETYWALQHQQ